MVIIGIKRSNQSLFSQQGDLDNAFSIPLDDSDVPPGPAGPSATPVPVPAPAQHQQQQAPPPASAPPAHDDFDPPQMVVVSRKASEFTAEEISEAIRQVVQVRDSKGYMYKYGKDEG